MIFRLFGFQLYAIICEIICSPKLQHKFYCIIQIIQLKRKNIVFALLKKEVNQNYYEAIKWSILMAIVDLTLITLACMFLAAHLAESQVTQLYMLGGSHTYSHTHTLTHSGRKLKNKSVLILKHWNLVSRFSEHSLGDCSNRFYLNMSPWCWWG